MALVKKLDSFLRAKRRKIPRGLHILPNIFTLGNAFFGFCSIIFASTGDYIASAYFILLGAIMDSLDGRIARLARVTSDFGIQLDSLCDAISFCLAPAFLAYAWQLKQVGLPGLIAGTLFLAAGLLRLARFNITHLQQCIAFRGTPTPIAGCLIATIVLNAGSPLNTPISVLLFLLLVLVLALLMVSPIPFPTFKTVPKRVLPFVILVFWTVATTMGLTQMLLATFIIYFLFAFEEYIRHLLIHFRESKNQ